MNAHRTSTSMAALSIASKRACMGDLPSAMRSMASSAASLMGACVSISCCIAISIALSIFLSIFHLLGRTWVSEVDSRCRPPWLWPGSGTRRRRAEVSFLGSMPGFSSTMPLSTGKVEIMGVAAAERPRGRPRGRSAAAQARPSAVARGGACRGEFTYTVGHHLIDTRN